MNKNHYSMYFYSTCSQEFQSTALFDQPVRLSLIPAHDGLPHERIGTVARAVDQAIETGAMAFRREITLPRLIPVGPDEIADQSAAGRWRVVRRLAKALRGERTRGRAGHWTYSLNRHIGLLQAFKAERAALRTLGHVAGRTTRGAT